MSVPRAGGGGEVAEDCLGGILGWHRNDGGDLGGRGGGVRGRGM